jgi:hypothetical protein
MRAPLRSTTLRGAALVLALASPARPACWHHRSAPHAPVETPAAIATRVAVAPTTRAPLTGVSDAGFPPAAPAAPAAPALVREGAPLAMSREGDRLYAACEELRAIHVVLLPDAAHDRVRDLPVRTPGAPANVLVLADGRVLATVRDPGLLLVYRPDPAAGLVEAARVELAPDAWGLAVSPDGATAYVTSAWTHTVAAVDLAARAVRWKLDVPREPRGIVVHPRGPLYVSHLTSAVITRIDVADGVPRARAVSLPPSPLRTPRRGDVDASLGYALALSPDALRLYAPRHALGVIGEGAWFGAATVDVLMVPQDEPLAPRRASSLVEKHPPDTDAGFPGPYPMGASIDPRTGPIPTFDPIPFSQARAVVYRRTTGTLILAGEGDRWLTELDALAADPALHSLGSHGYFADNPCFAPSGVVLSADEQTAYVYCRTSFDVRSVNLAGDGGGWVHGVGVDPADRDTAMGRRLFYNGRRSELAEGVACSGCHPEGRDDGHVWHEVEQHLTAADGGLETGPDGGRRLGTTFFAGGAGIIDVGGRPRQTPMLAGRVRSPGPYGWLGESADVEKRIAAGARLHGWLGGGNLSLPGGALMTKQLAAFLRNGLTPPPHASRPLTAAEERGRALFERKDVACATCHLTDDDAPNLVVKLPKLPTREWFDDEDVALKVPSLRFVGGTPPYLHDGSAATLSELLETNGDRMGHTSTLTAAERADLAAYLETL